MKPDTERSKTAREREIDQLLERAEHTETAEELDQRIRAAGGTRADVVFEIRRLTGASVSPKSLAAWWDAVTA